MKRTYKLTKDRRKVILAAIARGEINASEAAYLLETSTRTVQRWIAGARINTKAARLQYLDRMAWRYFSGITKTKEDKRQESTLAYELWLEQKGQVSNHL